MKLLIWLWSISLAIIGFKVFRIFNDPAAFSPADTDKLVGMVLVFGLISIAIILGWIFGAVRQKLFGARADPKSTERKPDLSKQADFAEKLARSQNA
ncbi:hypothetical protein ACFORG_04995 [Lutimaribacter marinistellae]|uniref:Lipopolysaccharide assembly protein A domain-containing protein n=1 Tax=Lutimaribacter marinistellae TaxID=1820329 RepID=A0ABV7TD45_9RHOB